MRYATDLRDGDAFRSDGRTVTVFGRPVHKGNRVRITIAEGLYPVIFDLYEPVPVPFVRACPECGLTFDLSNTDDANAWFYGHDCEA